MLSSNKGKPSLTARRKQELAGEETKAIWREPSSWPKATERTALYITTGFTYTLFRQSIKQANDDIEVRVDLELCSTCML